MDQKAHNQEVATDIHDKQLQTLITNLPKNLVDVKEQGKGLKFINVDARYSVLD